MYTNGDVLAAAELALNPWRGAVYLILAHRTLRGRPAAAARRRINIHTGSSTSSHITNYTARAANGSSAEMSKAEAARAEWKLKLDHGRERVDEENGAQMAPA